ncbi:hypothetical protein CAEBREN_02609 [Caenorhabditis brenneri]|uniref:C-type lectin domain-containing protein n=1 Tax=Caenorhabditis brenneri TaxID=135651 RepID=G0PAS8_CAEBE|nr:hypothetical protein CAEBREN_02609 [Caenorhabditis brenneri]
MRLLLLLLVFGMTATLGHFIEGKSSISFGNPSFHSSSSSESSSNEGRSSHRHRHSGRHGRRPPRPIQNDHSHSHEYDGGEDGGENRGCGRGWKRFDRPTGGWCIKVAQGQFSQAQAESKCQVEGGTLSGLQDTNEISYITSTAIRLFPERTGSLWVGARRSPACSRAPLSSSCNRMTSFTWTDGSTTGTAGFQWAANQPDNSHFKTQHCAVLLASSPSSDPTWNWLTNKLDDEACVNPTGSYQRIVRGYVCGKRANERRRK